MKANLLPFKAKTKLKKFEWQEFHLAYKQIEKLALLLLNFYFQDKIIFTYIWFGKIF